MLLRSHPSFVNRGSPQGRRRGARVRGGTNGVPHTHARELASLRCVSVLLDTSHYDQAFTWIGCCFDGSHYMIRAGLWLVYMSYMYAYICMCEQPKPSIFRE